MSDATMNAQDREELRRALETIMRISGRSARSAGAAAATSASNPFSSAVGVTQATKDSVPGEPIADAATIKAGIAIVRKAAAEGPHSLLVDVIDSVFEGVGKAGKLLGLALPLPI